MKKIFLLFIGVLIFVGCESKNDNDSLSIEYKNESDCSKAELVMTKDNRKIYNYCLNNIKIISANKEKTLEEYLEEDNAIDNIIDGLEVSDVLYDGGTTVYKGKNITLINCNTLSGNKDVYIGNKDMKYKENFCKDNNYTFIKTYTINNVEKYDEQQYEEGIPVYHSFSFKVDLKDSQGLISTVIINQYIEIEAGKTYEFEFMLYDNATDIEDNPEYIFKNSIIVEIKETDKVGLNQIQEEVK